VVKTSKNKLKHATDAQSSSNLVKHLQNKTNFHLHSKTVHKQLYA